MHLKKSVAPIYLVKVCQEFPSSNVLYNAREEQLYKITNIPGVSAGSSNICSLSFSEVGALTVASNVDMDGFH